MQNTLKPIQSVTRHAPHYRQYSKQRVSKAYTRERTQQSQS